MERANTSSTETSTAPGAVYLIREDGRDTVYAIAGKASAVNEALSASIVADLHAMIEQIDSPNCDVVSALSSHAGDRAEIGICGAFPDSDVKDKLADGTRFNEVFIRHDQIDVPDTAVELPRDSVPVAPKVRQ